MLVKKSPNLPIDLEIPSPAYQTVEAVNEEHQEDCGLFVGQRCGAQGKLQHTFEKVWEMFWLCMKALF